MGSFDQRLVATTTGDGPVVTQSVGEAHEESKVLKKSHQNIAARASRPIVMSNENQVTKVEKPAMKKPQVYPLHSLLQEHTPVRSAAVLVQLDNTRDFLESNCDIPREDVHIQRMPSHFMTHQNLGRTNPRSSNSSSSINRTPKSEIRQPGQLFEKSGTRGSSQNKTSTTMISL